MTDDVIHSTKYYIKYINRAIFVNLQQKTIETWQANSSKCNTPTALTIFCYHGNLLYFFNILVALSLEDIKEGHELNLTYLKAC